MVYMLTLGVYIDGKCYHIYIYIAYMDPMGDRGEDLQEKICFSLFQARISSVFGDVPDFWWPNLHLVTVSPSRFCAN